MSSMFGFFDLDLRALNAAPLGLQIAGVDIANATTPGYAKRGLEFAPDLPVRVDSGLPERGVQIVRIRRVDNQLIQAVLRREKGALGGKSPSHCFADGLARLESDLSRVDVAREVSDGLVADLAARREAVSGVTLDEDTAELIKNKRSYEAAAALAQAQTSVDALSATAARVLGRSLFDYLG